MHPFGARHTVPALTRSLTMRPLAAVRSAAGATRASTAAAARGRVSDAGALCAAAHAAHASAAFGFVGLSQCDAERQKQW